jgi:phosphoglucomutase
MDSFSKYRFWLENSYFDDETKKELEAIKHDREEIEERFYKDLEFGTAGLRGLIGAGTNRMNIYTVRKASQGLAGYILRQGQDARNRGMVIAYDSRHMSSEFAMEAARVFAGNGIKAYLFDELRPAPELSFAVRHLNADGGIMITASHNPKEYNGYKAYGEDGCQLSPEAAGEVLKEIDRLGDITKVKMADIDEAIEGGMIRIIGKEIDDDYIERLKTLSINPQLTARVGETFKVIYTPLHGTGNKPVRRILAETGFKNVLTVKEQEFPDPEFPTVKTPNPEDKAAFSLAISLAQKENIDLIIGTDPDCDRVGIVVKDGDGDFTALTGNQTGCLLMEYILSQKKAMGNLPSNGFVVKTIVTTELARKIADSYGVEIIDVLTGFKFIGEKIKLLDEFGDKKFLFGYEESYGYLAGTFSRDKDGVVTSMLIAEMAAYYYSKNMTLYDALQELFKKYGYAKESISSFTLEGKAGLEKIHETMSKLREDKPSRFGSSQVHAIRDYLEGKRYVIGSDCTEELTLPKSNVLYYEMKDDSWFCIRPSGTEPKIKVYFGVLGDSHASAQEKLNTLEKDVLGVVQELLN